MSTRSSEAQRPFDDLPTSRAGRVAWQISEEIQRGKLAPGVRIGTKEELRQRFNVAVATINEAVRLLEAQGAIQARPGPGGGVFVTAPSSRVQLRNLVLRFKADAKAMADCLVIRNALEPLVCEDAARSGADVAPLRKILKQMDTLDAAEYLHGNWQFHREIAKMGPNETLGAIYIMLLDFVEEGLDIVESTKAFHPQQDLAVHHEIADVIEAQDLKGVRAAVQRHAPIVEQRARELYDGSSA